MKIVAALFAACFSVVALAQVPVAQAAHAKSPDVYQKWLDEDVRYIITLAERAQFLALQSDEQRDRFVIEFWKHRDPTPATPENEFKEEHYRRLAYANQHFASNEAGWKTDRGRTYIVLGPPDEIQTSSYRQVWRYKAAKSDFVFIDTCKCGEYKLTVTPK